MEMAQVPSLIIVYRYRLVYDFHFPEVSNVDVRIGDLSTPRRAAGGAAVGSFPQLPRLGTAAAKRSRELWPHCPGPWLQ